VVTPTLIAVGFLVATAGVMALARGSTARWERDKRASVAARAEGSVRRTSPAGSAFRRPGALTRRGAAALRSQASRLPPVRVVAGLLPKAAKQGSSRVRPIRRLVGDLRSWLSGGKVRGERWTKLRSAAGPVDGDAADTALAKEPTPVATGSRGDAVARAARRKVWQRTVRRAPRRALAFLHRHEDSRDARIPHEDSDQSPTAQ
jgi:hypothetical protein